jgi:tetratricopeptide (TPR) repeat protein
MMDAASFVSQFRAAAPGPLETVEKLYGLGHWLLSQERYADAALAFRTMLRSAPEDERSWLALATCHEQAGQLRIALELYGAGTALVPTSVRCQIARARLLCRLNRDVEADEALDKASEIASELADDELIRLVDAERKNPCH